MKTLFKKGIAFIALTLISVVLLFAEETPINHLYSYTLDNGLSVFVAENHSAPLVYIEVAVRTGAISQSPENAGLFHLYEHMMFKGNPKYQNAQAIQSACKSMGVPSWNGTTDVERVNYYFTVPTDQLEKGLEFWSYAIREPLMDLKEFEDEKKVVISEIQGYFGKPDWQTMWYSEKTLIPEAPWTYDPCGSVENVQNATVEQLKEIQKKYYIPNNAAVFVGGDVNPDEVYKLVDKIYGNWEEGEDPWKDESEAFAANPLSAPKYAVIPYDECPPQLMQVGITYRSADADYNLSDTYIADAFAKVTADPLGKYKNTILKNKNLQIPDSGYIWTSYALSRRHASLTFASVMLNPSENPVNRVSAFYNTVMKKALPAFQKDKSLESSKKRNLFKQALIDNQAYEAESAKGLLTTLSYYWTSATRDYYFNYLDNMLELEKKDFDAFLNDYVYSRNPLITVYVNPAVYEQTKDAFAKAGYEEISAENAFWWKK